MSVHHLQIHSKNSPAYGCRDNRHYLKAHGIRFAGKPLGRPKKVTEENRETLKRLKAQRQEEYLQRIPIEGKFGQGKDGYRLNYIRAKRADTSVAWINSWNINNGLRSPNYSFTGTPPARFSARIAPQLVGMGLLEAIDEADIEALEDPGGSDGDGISGRIRLVTDAETGQTRVGRFGWKASQPSVKQQVSAALNTDIGVMTSIHDMPDCGAQQSGCGASGAELADQYLDTLSAYISLLGVSARRDLSDPVALQGEAVFNSTGCAACHIPTF